MPVRGIERRRGKQEPATSGRLEICLVGPGLKFLSGLSVYTNRLAAVLAERHFVSVLLLRDLIPARFYPGGDRVGQPLSSLSYDAYRTHEGLDWWWGRSLLSSLRFLRARPPDIMILQWWTAAAAHTYLALALIARIRKIKVIIEFHETQDTGEAALPGVAVYGRVALRALVKLSNAALVHHEHDLRALREMADFADMPVEVASHAGYDHLLDVLPQMPPELLVAAVDPANEPSEAFAGRRVVLFFGLIRPYKGLTDFVSAIGKLSAEDAARLHFVICGETWEGCTEGVIAARQSPHAERISIVNRYVSDSEAAALFGIADALVLPYKRSSSSGPMAIAMSFGMDVIYYDVAGLAATASGYHRSRPVEAGNVDALAGELHRYAWELGDRSVDESVPVHTPTWADTADAYGRLFAGLTENAVGRV